LLLARGFIDNLYVHMGFHSAWKYEAVVELVFDTGVLTGEFDRSRQMAELRREITGAKAADESGPIMTRDDIAKFVEQSFDRKYP
jgi:hypothetical protein